MSGVVRFKAAPGGALRHRCLDRVPGEEGGLTGTALAWTGSANPPAPGRGRGAGAEATPVLPPVRREER